MIFVESTDRKKAECKSYLARSRCILHVNLHITRNVNESCETQNSNVFLDHKEMNFSNSKNLQRSIIMPVTPHLLLSMTYQQAQRNDCHDIGNWPGRENVATAVGLLSPANLTDY